MNFSTTIAGLIVFGLAWLAGKLNMEAPSHSDVLITVITVVKAFGILMTYLGRYRQGDITWYGAKLTPAEPVTVDPASDVFKQPFRVE